MRLQGHLAVSSLSLAPELPAAFQNSSRQAQKWAQLSQKILEEDVLAFVTYWAICPSQLPTPGSIPGFPVALSPD